MQTDRLLIFGSYRWDPQTGQLWRGKQEVRLTGKAVAVLRYLVERAGQVVTKDELFAAVWPQTVVSDAALASCIQELRQALREHAKRPRYIATVHRRGFQFLGKVVSDQFSVVSQDKGVSIQHSVVSSREQSGVRSPTSDVKSSHSAIRIPPAPSVGGQSAMTLVGREAELTQLHGWLAKALSGERQIVFVTGEPGIGKTTLVEVFLQSLESRVQRLASNGQSLASSVQRLEAAEQRPIVAGQTLDPRLSNSRLSDPRRETLDAVPWLSRGQCIEHYGAGEAYLPVLEALGRLCRESEGQRLIGLLSQHAPTWLVQMPSLLNDTELEALQRKTAGVTRERMLRELAEALEVITVERPLVLVLEDLHWSDVSTLDLLSMLARRQEPARLLVIGTYRPVEVLTRDHPLKEIKQELQVHGQCEELALDFLSEAAVGEYLAVRFPAPSPATAGEGWGEGQFPTTLRKLSHLIHHRTDGNPLFMVNLVDHLLSQGVLVQTDGQWVLKNEDLAATVPENLRQLIEQQLARVNPEERKVLEAASVVGAEFSAAAVAAGTEQPTEAVETYCDGLLRREQFLRTHGTSEWPNGTIAARYGFVHALYQEVLYGQLSATRRVRLHRQIGEREEQGYGERAREISAELAVHFERGRDYWRAVQYLQHAGENAAGRSAHHEAIRLLTKGLELLKTLPDIPERTQQELTLQIALGVSLTATKGWAAPERERAYTRAQELCQQLGDTPQLFRVLQALIGSRLMQVELQTARELGEQCLTLAQHLHEPALLLRAYYSLGVILLYLGELVPARAHLEQGIALSAEGPRRYDPRYALANPATDCRSLGAMALWLLGYPDQALQRSYEGLTLAQESSQPFSVVLALQWTARLHRVRREGHAAQEQAEAQITLAAEHEFPNYLAWGTIERGWALAEQGQGEEGIAQICQGLAAQGRRPAYLVILAAAYEKAGLAAEGIRVAAEALAMADKSGERFYDPELYRLKGELTLQQFKVQGSKFKVEESPASEVRSPKSPNPKSQSLNPKSQGEAEACFLKAIDIARKQQAKSLELRATTSLARLWQQRGKKKQAHKMLSKIYNWFTEGFDTKDLQEAKALLEELSY